MNRVDLIVPGLLNLPLDELGAEGLQQSTPYLHKILRFAQKRRNSFCDIDDILIHRLQLKQPALPYAYAMNPESEVEQMLFKPVFLKTDINNAIVHPINDDYDAFNKVINDLKDYFKEDCEIKALNNDTWLMRLHNEQALAGMPHVLTATGKKVSHYLDQAKSNLGWFKLFNEMQMYLFQHDINQQRFVSGLPMLNSLWCWGGDAYGGESFSSLAWYSDDKQMRKLGELYTGTSQPVSDLPGHDSQQDAIVINLALLEALKGASTRNIEELLKTLDSDYLGPIMRCRAKAIHLHTGGEWNFYFTQYMAWRLWRQEWTWPG